MSVVSVCLMLSLLQLASSGYPYVTTVIVGSHSTLSDKPYKSAAVGSVVVVKATGGNIIVDSATSDVDLDGQLGKVVGLSIDDIDLVVLTHTHPDHYENGYLFKNVPLIWGKFQVQGRYFQATQLFYDQTFNVFDDKNLEVLLTPGHTPDDVTLIVSHVNGTNKTVGIVGDLFFNETDLSQPDLWQSLAFDVELQRESRKTVACRVDFIVPGHGLMFQVSDDLKQNTFHCSGSSTSSALLFLVLFLLLLHMRQQSTR